MRQLSLPFVYPLHNWQCFFFICLNLVFNPIIQLTRVVIVVYCLDKGRVGTCDLLPWHLSKRLSIDTIC